MLKRKDDRDHLPRPRSRYAEADSTTAMDVGPSTKDGDSANAGVTERGSDQKDPVPRSLRQQSIFMRFTSRSWEEVSSNKLKYLALCSNISSIFDVEQLTQLARIYSSPLFTSYTIHDPKYSMSNFIMLSDQLNNGTEVASFVQRSKIVTFDLTRRAGMEAAVIMHDDGVVYFRPNLEETNFSSIGSSWNSGALSFLNGKTNRLWESDVDTDLELLHIRGLLPRLYGHNTDGEAFTHPDGPFVLESGGAINFEDQPKEDPYNITRYIGLLSSVYDFSATDDKVKAISSANVNAWQKMRQNAPYFAASKSDETELQYPTTTFVKSFASLKYVSECDVLTGTIKTHYPTKISKLLVKDESGMIAYSPWSDSKRYTIPPTAVDILQNVQVGANAAGEGVSKFITVSPHYCCRGNPPLYKNFYHNAMSRMELNKAQLSHKFITMIPMQKASGENILQRASFLLEQEVGMEFYFQQDEMDEEIGDNDLGPAVVRGELKPATTTGGLNYGNKIVFYF